jgi:hypothetical protein
MASNLDENGRLARARALTAMHQEGQRHIDQAPRLHQAEAKAAANSAGSVASSTAEPLIDPALLNDQLTWSKTRIVGAIPSWESAHKREISYLNAWLDSLCDE